MIARGAAGALFAAVVVLVPGSTWAADPKPPATAPAKPAAQTAAKPATPDKTPAAAAERAAKDGDAAPANDTGTPVHGDQHPAKDVKARAIIDLAALNERIQEGVAEVAQKWKEKSPPAARSKAVAVPAPAAPPRIRLTWRAAVHWPAELSAGAAPRQPDADRVSLSWDLQP